MGTHAPTTIVHVLELDGEDGRAVCAGVAVDLPEAPEITGYASDGKGERGRYMSEGVLGIYCILL